MILIKMVSIEEYLRKLGFSEYDIRKQLNKIKKCKHKKTEPVKEFRKNYPFGKKSSIHYNFKEIWGKRCENCGLLFTKRDSRFYEEDW